MGTAGNEPQPVFNRLSGNGGRRARGRHGLSAKSRLSAKKSGNGREPTGSRPFRSSLLRFASDLCVTRSDSALQSIYGQEPTFSRIIARPSSTIA